MPPLWATGGRLSTSIDAASNYGTSVTAGGTASTKGSYAQLGNANGFTLPWDAPFGFFWSMKVTTAASEYFADLAINTTPTIVVPNMPFSGVNGSVEELVYIPLALAAGAAVKIRTQCTTASAASTHQIHPAASGWLGQRTFARCETLGVNTSTTRGVVIATGTTANTKTTYSVIGTTGFRWKAMMVIIGGQASNARTTSADFKFDLAVGATGSEQIVLPDARMLLANTTQVQGVPRKHGPFPVDFPASTQLSMRTACSAASAVSFDFMVMGFG